MPTPSEYVARDGSRTWRVRLRAHGKYTSETFGTERDAKKFCKLIDAVGGPAAIAARDRSDAASTAYVPTLAEWLPQHIEQLTGVTDRTRMDYAAMAERTFLPIVGDLPLDAIDRAAVAKVINGLDSKGLSAKSIANAHGLLSSAMATAVIAEHIGVNPCHRMRLPRTREEDRRDERYLTHAEYASLHDAMPAEHRPLMVLLFATGLRWSEAVALDVRDIVPGEVATLRVTKAWKRTPGQGYGKGLLIGPPKSAKSRRTVMLASQALTELVPLLDRPGDARLFTAAQGGIVHHGAWRSRVWIPACRDAGLASPYVKGQRYDGPRIHDARHTHASWLIEQGATLEMVQDQLGHESILTTRKVYGHLQPAMRTALAGFATAAMASAALPEGKAAQIEQ